MKTKDIETASTDTVVGREQQYSATQDLTTTVTPLPKAQVLVVAFIMFTEPLSSTVLFPFIYQMLKGFHLSDDEKEIGHYAGWANSMFFIGQLLTAIQWGSASDRYGRRPVLLIGLMGNAITSCLFGLSQSFWWAVGARLLCGVLNGNSGVARSTLTEITDRTNRAKAFTIMSFCISSGITAGPAIGGYLCRPAEQFPTLFGNNQFLIKFPYFLPCFVSSIISLVGFSLGYLKLKESNPIVIGRIKHDKKPTEETSLLNKPQIIQGQIYAQKIRPDTQLPSSPKPFEWSSFKKVKWASYISIFCFSIFSFNTFVFDEVQPLFVTAPSYAGGLGLTSRNFAKVVATGGFIMAFSHLIIYPKLHQCLSTLSLARVAMVVYTFVFVIFPELLPLQSWIGKRIDDPIGGSSFLYCYFALTLIRNFANGIAYTSFFMIVNNSAGPGLIGLVNGISQSFLSFSRALAPTLGGSLWAFSLHCTKGFPFDRHLVYYTIALVCSFGFLLSYTLPNSLSLGGKPRTTQ